MEDSGTEIFIVKLTLIIRRNDAAEDKRGGDRRDHHCAGQQETQVPI